MRTDLLRNQSRIPLVQFHHVGKQLDQLCQERVPWTHL